MSKKYFCAKCGLELDVKQKAIPHEGRVMNLVKPHVCEETSSSDLDEDVQPKEVKVAGAFEILDGIKERKIDKKIDKLFDEMPFVQKLNKASAEHEIVTEEAGDKRDKKHLRDELVTSTAPTGVLSVAQKKGD